jgi:stearoyl-CoA desaturase (Delta-9 desaturase)
MRISQPAYSVGLSRKLACKRETMNQTQCKRSGLPKWESFFRLQVLYFLRSVGLCPGAEPLALAPPRYQSSSMTETVAPPLAPPAGNAPRQEPPERCSALTRIATLVAVVAPFLGLLAAIVCLWGRGLSWLELGLFLGMYVLTVLGITVGFHRQFTHRSFETNRVVQFILGVLGSMAVQGSLFQWVAYHRQHHQHSDRPEDPHSPHHYGAGLRGLVRGLWHAHFGWFFTSRPANFSRYVKDLRQSALLRSVSALFPVWVLAGLLIPTGAGALLLGGWTGALLGLVWGGLVRIFFVHHVTWSVNSVCHLWGRQPFPNHDHSRNNLVFGLLALGEGWHNNHHAFPSSARHGFRWWQVDVSYWVIRGLAALRLAWNVKGPAIAALGA